MSEIPSDWVHLSRPSPWEGVAVRHYSAGPSEIDFDTGDRLCLTLVKRASQHCELRPDGGRWKQVDLHPGCIIYVPQGYRGGSRSRESVEAINVVLDWKWLRGAEQKPVEREKIEQSKFGLEDKVIAQLILDIQKDNLDGAPFGLAYTEALAMSAWHRFQAVNMRHRDGQTKQAPRLIDQAIEYIHANPDAQLSIRDVASAVGYGSDLSAFSRLFKLRSGKPPHQYILDLRLQQAKVLLLEQKMTVTQVALQCGFSSISHFSVMFKNRWGVAPSLLLNSTEKVLESPVHIPSAPSAYLESQRSKSI